MGRVSTLLLFWVSCATAFHGSTPRLDRTGGIGRRRAVGGVTMMARRNYYKYSRNDFLITSTAASAALFPFLKRSKTVDNAVKEAGVSNSDGGSSTESDVPFIFNKPYSEALEDLQEAITRYLNSADGAVAPVEVKKSTQSLVSLTYNLQFQSGDRLKLDFNTPGRVMARAASTAGGCGAERRLNYLAHELAGMGGWRTTGFPLTS